MGGEGAMMAMINAIKNNKSLLAKRKDKKALSGSYGSAKLNFKEATPEILQEIRERLIKERKQRMVKTVIVSIIVFAVLVTFLIFII